MSDPSKVSGESSASAGREALSRRRDEATGTRILADTHVHLHPGFALSRLLDSAASNFYGACRTLDIADAVQLLVLCDCEGRSDWESIIRRAQQRLAADSWQLESTAEGCSIRAVRTGGEEIYLIAGRQIRTIEDLEVLSLGESDSVHDGETLEGTLARVADAGAIPVIPWGFGKWWGARGREVQKMLNRSSPQTFYVGDNGGRLAGMPVPSLFRLAARKGVGVLAGTDPFPFAGQEKRAASYGSFFRADFERERPASSLKQALNRRSLDIRTYGVRESLPPFILNQVRMQLKKRGNRFFFG